MQKLSPSFRPTILKLGGSVITHKEKERSANWQTIKRLAREISMAQPSHLVVIHGGGSFGHPLAKRYSIMDGYKNDPSQVLGYSETRQAMVALNKLVVDALIRHNIPSVTVSPSSCTVTKSGRIHAMMMEPVTKLLQIGSMPILYGDAVLDLDVGFTILSGDQLAAYLATRLHASKIILGIDEDGLHTKDPKKESSAPLITRITVEELKKMQRHIEKPKAIDVTGGMFGKIVELIPVVEAGISALIVNAAKPKRVYRALKGESVIGTLIERG